MMIHRRHLLAGLAAAPFAGHAAFANTPRELDWDELIPAGTPYSEIIADGAIDEVNDTWLPVFDENSHKFSENLNGVQIRMPGFVLPLDMVGVGVTEFILTPYVGACVHVPPPPPNQLVFVKTETPWHPADLFEAVWITGTLRVNPLMTHLAEIGYEVTADNIEIYEWL